MKKVISIVLTLLLVVSMICPVQAADTQQVTPRYTYIQSIYACISIDTTWGIATCEGEIDAKAGYPVEVVVYLQVYKNGEWETIKSWSAEDTYAVYLSKSYAVMSGYTYRAYVEGYVYNSSGVLIETASISHSADYLVPQT